MTDYPIIFSTPMVQAILGGVKTQTRRIAKLNAAGRVARKGKNWHPDDPEAILACPYGQPGDQLWVRETWNADVPEIVYKADMGTRYLDEDHPHYMDLLRLDLLRLYDKQIGGWRPSIHMPKWAARIHLRITMVRLQRLQKISFEDAKNEGVEFWRSTETLKGLPACACHYYEFEDLWAHINGRDSWNLNPLVWTLDFEVEK